MPKRKTRLSFFGNFLLLLIILALILLLAYLNKYSFQSPSQQRTYEILESIPREYSIYGIDISRYQKKINWEKLSRFRYKHVTISFIMIKATEGTNYVDPFFHDNWKNSKKYGFITGAYHYFKPHQDPIIQMNNFLKTVSFSPGDFIVVDIEEYPIYISKATFQNNIMKALQYVEEKLKTKPILYTNVSFYRQYFMNKRFEKYPLWIAHYYQQSPPSDIPWVFWQFHDKMSLNGISENVDMNIFCCSYSELKKFLIQ
ncbi:MAG: GH25 family lysozyme [Bacteroidales bacterium]|nr:GH25 family lysozyme [Bacteroidales bacterium]